jgi:hypothetical protein
VTGRREKVGRSGDLAMGVLVRRMRARASYSRRTRVHHRATASIADADGESIASRVTSRRARNDDRACARATTR